MDYTKHSPTILSLCTGMRGIERGIERACVRLNWAAPETVVNVEIEAFAAWNLAKQMEKGLLAPAAIWTNIKTFPWQCLSGKIDFIIGGYPCQPFSLAGKQKGTDDPRHLWPNIKVGIETIKPVGCFFENVRNHLNIGYEEVRADLQRLGYEVREGIYSAEEAGAPHKRDRLFILAIRRDVELDNANGCEQSAVPRDTGEVLGVQEAECESKLGSALSGGASYKLGHSNGQRLQVGLCGELRSISEKISSLKRSKPFRTNSENWPAPQGIFQYEYEEPRLESRMGFTINGHNFTEDLLRMAGNGVVEQVAELAFIELLNKHFEK